MANLRKHYLLFFLFCFMGAWVLVFWDVYANPNLLLPRDNYRSHYSYFLYIAKYLKHLHAVPTWLIADNGGIWLPVLANNFLLLLPYRILGYGLAAATPFSPALMYKFCFLFLGQGLFLWGVYALSKMVFKSTRYALLMVALALVSSLCVANLHQEHAIATIFVVPFLWMALIKLKSDVRYLVVVASLIGLGLNVHYPQLLFGYLAIIAISSLFCFKATFGYLKSLAERLKANHALTLVSWAAIAFIISASPFLYSAGTYIAKLESPFRAQQGSIAAKTLEQYIPMNGTKSSLKPNNLKKYLGYDKYPTESLAKFDDKILYLTPAIPFMLFILLFFGVPFRFFHLSTIGLLAIFSTGIYGPALQYLWHVFPGIAMFRQWIFFSTYLNLHLLFLIGLCLKAFWEFKPVTQTQRATLYGGVALFLALFAFKLLGPLYGLFPALLLAIKAIPEPKFRPAVLTALTVLWVFVGSLPWAFFTTIDYQKGLVRASTPNHLDPYLDISKTVNFFIVQPRGVQTNVYQGLAKNAPFYWRTDKNEMTAAKDSEVWTHAVAGGFQVAMANIPEKVKALLMVQVNDDGWKANIDDGRPVSLWRGPGGMVEIPLSHLRTSFTIRRKFSPWLVFIFMMWLPLISSYIWIRMGSLTREWRPILIKRQRYVSLSAT